MVWVCDLADSSRFLNDNQTAGELEEFLQRLYWVSSMIVDASGGTFIKWTGDGFLAWFETPLHRDLSEQAAAAFQAAWTITLMVNVTQLGLNPKRKFVVRHGMAYEQDAMLIKIKHKGGHESLDLIGRAVVLAFRLSGIAASFPGIVCQKVLVDADANNKDTICRFNKLRLSANDRLKYFKGERWGIEQIYASDNAALFRNRKATLKHARDAVDKAEGRKPYPKEDVKFGTLFVKNMMDGPDWCQKVLEDTLRFCKDELLGRLKSIIPLLEVEYNSGRQEISTN